MTTRVGQGFDVHAFGPGDHVRLGGVAIPHSHGLVAHSDGDADSRGLLRDCVALVAARGLRPLNCDLTIIAQAPRIAPHVEAMCALLADDLGIAVDAVNVKATTSERLGALGRGEGIAALAITLLTDA